MSVQLRFTKMHGLGNDFVVIDLITQRFNFLPEHARRLADRHMGIGCDQILLVEAPCNPEVDFRYRIFNADGDEVEQCGNGARCFARFVREKKLTSKRNICVETATGMLHLKVRNRSDVQVNMGTPIFEPLDIPFKADQLSDSYTLEVDSEAFEIGALSMGNPHAVLRVEDVATAPVAALGTAIESHSRFPRRVNVGFMQRVSAGELKLRVFERGVGETLACGSGACAAMVYARSRGWVDEMVTVELPGGKLSVSWAGDEQPVYMIGPTEVVFEGSVVL
ncbi:MAG: diaminopimelate epimerase [Pseudomonadota bacterium]